MNCHLLCNSGTLEMTSTRTDEIYSHIAPFWTIHLTLPETQTTNPASSQPRASVAAQDQSHLLQHRASVDPQENSSSEPVIRKHNVHEHRDSRLCVCVCSYRIQNRTQVCVQRQCGNMRHASLFCMCASHRHPRYQNGYVFITAVLSLQPDILL